MNDQTVLEELKRNAKSHGMGLMARASYETEFAIVVRLLELDERVAHVLSKSRLLVLTDRRILTVSCRVSPHEIDSIAYAGLRDIAPNRVTFNHGVAVTYRGVPLVLTLEKKHIDLVVTELRHLVAQYSSIVDFSDSQSVILFVTSELGERDLALVEEGLPVLASRVQPYEIPIAAVVGDNHRATSLLLMTDRRLLIGSYDGAAEGDDEVTIAALRGAEVSSGVWRATLSIRTYDGRYDFVSASKGDAHRFAAAINHALANRSARPMRGALLSEDSGDATNAGADPSLDISAPTDVVDQLERLASLHRDGVLTSEEFAQAKRNVLDADRC